MPTCYTSIPLGVGGGMDESNLPCFLIAPNQSSQYVCLDAGTLYAGLKIASANRCFDDIAIPGDSPLRREGHIRHHHIRAILITYPYLDHLQGLANISPEDSAKPIDELAGVLHDLKEHLLNCRSWPNLSSKGQTPGLGKYRYVPLRY